MAELKQFRLPDVGEGLTEADIVTWRVKPGDRVSVNQVIVEIETAKSLVELPCPYEGVVTGLLVPEGQSVDVGTPIIEVDTAPGEPGAAPAARAPAQQKADQQEADQQEAPPQEATVRQEPAAPQEAAGEAARAPAAALNEAFAPGGDSGTREDLVPPHEAGAEPGVEGTLKPKPERQAVLVGYGVKLGTTTRRPRKGRPAPGQPPGAPPASPPAASSAPASPAPASPASGDGATGAGANGRSGTVAPGRPAAKPPVRKLAKDLGVDLAALTGTGPDGTITREDVQAAAGQAAPAAGAAAGAAVAQPVRPAAAGGEERISIRGVQKHMAAAMTASAFTAPHVTEFLQVDMTETMRALARLRDVPEFAGLKLSPLLLVAKALLVAVARHPMINSSWDEDAQEIVVKHYVNLGIAAATDRGLIVPNIKDAHTLPLPALAAALAELARVAREGRTQPADQAGGTITITNVGVFGVDTGTPILTPGQAAILAFGQVKEAPWVHEGALAVRSVTTLALSFDHRIVDGALGSAALRDIGDMLTDPVRMIAWA
jgi:2-oxoisovalerate dehydrogenase E2 component (dihydrolipoyl transacylase)